jgi:hypothetical protein
MSEGYEEGVMPTFGNKYYVELHFYLGRAVRIRSSASAFIDELLGCRKML